MSVMYAYRKYREDHVIEAVTPPEQRGRGIAGGYYVCSHDGIRVYRRRGGWQHDPEGVRAAREEYAQATDVWPTSTFVKAGAR